MEHTFGQRNGKLWFYMGYGRGEPRLYRHGCYSNRRYQVKEMENKYSLEGKVIIVTGGTGILGNSFVNGIVEAGGTVGILGRNAVVANERADAINKKGDKAIALVADVLNEKDLLEAKTQVWDTFGRLDGLVNGA